MSFTLELQFCISCLETEKNLYFLDKYHMRKPYEQLMGYSVYEEQIVSKNMCAECIYTLVNFCKFKNKCLKARSIMEDLLRINKYITMDHIKSVDRDKHLLKSALSKTSLEPGHCDLYVDCTDADTQTDIDAIETVVVKQEDAHKAGKDLSKLMTDLKTVFGKNDLKSDQKLYDVDVKLETHKCANFGAIDLDCLSDSTLILEAESPEELAENTEYSGRELCTNTKENNNEGISNKNTVNTIIPQHESDISMNVSSYIRKTDNEKTDFLVKHKTESFVELQKKNGKVLANTYSCDICAFNCKLKISLAVHMRSHEENSFACKLCDYKSKLRHSLNLHMLKHSDVNFKDKLDANNKQNEKYYFACNNCEYKTREKEHLAQHFTTHSGERRHLCQFCGDRLSCDCLLKKHLLDHKPQTNFDGNTGKSHFNNENESRKLYPCELCDSKFKLKVHLTRHMKIHAEEKPFVCRVCNKMFLRKDSLGRHTLLHTGEKPYACQLCDSMFIRKKHFKKHKRVHSHNKLVHDDLNNDCKKNKKFYHCTLCESKFKLSGHLTRHMLTHSGEKSFRCHLCEQKFSQKVSLQKHLLLHVGNKPHACDICPYKCTKKCDLVKHKRVHTGEKPFVCTYCDFRCKTSYTLITHTRAHTGEKPFVCNLCDYKCSRTSQLVRHKRTHTGEKSFSCHLCEYTCTRHCNLQAHMRVHTGDMLLCNYCSYKTANKACLVVHIKRHMKLKR